MTVFTPQSTTGQNVVVSMAAGDYTYVAPNVNLFSSNDYVIEESSHGTVDVYGSAVGLNGLYFNTPSNYTSELFVGAAGVVEAFGNGTSVVDSGSLDVRNYGQITNEIFSTAIQSAGDITLTNYGSVSSEQSAVYASSGNSTLVVRNAGSITGALDGAGDIQISNEGTILGADAVRADSATANNRLFLTNLGTIDASSYALEGGGEVDNVQNAGIIKGSIDMGSGVGSVFNSSLGRVFGEIRAGGGGDTVVAGINGGNVYGANGNDNLQANQSRMAADDHAQFMLDGEGGANALYGGGAFNTFASGDANGGHNQIHGGLSQMSDVAGYANNTISFARTPQTQSVYVDLLSGHNAYLYSTNAHTGVLTFEDSIQNVPNVIGSAGGDLIRADNGTDVIQGGGGADLLYAGTGVDTFTYTNYQDSNTMSGYDSIAGFVTGKDKLDLSAFNSAANHLAILSNSNSTVVYLEQTPGTFHSATDLAISFSGANAIKASDVIF